MFNSFFFSILNKEFLFVNCWIVAVETWHQVICEDLAANADTPLTIVIFPRKCLLEADTWFPAVFLLPGRLNLRFPSSRNSFETPCRYSFPFSLTIAVLTWTWQLCRFIDGCRTGSFFFFFSFCREAPSSFFFKDSRFDLCSSPLKSVWRLSL